MEKDKAGDCRYPKSDVGIRKPGFPLLASDFSLSTPSPFPFPTLERDLPKLKYWVDASASLSMEKDKAGNCRYPKSGVGLWKHGFTLLASCFPPLTPSPFPFPTLERDLPKLKHWADASASLSIEKEKAGDCRYPKSGVGLWKPGFTLLAPCFPLSTPSPFPIPTLGRDLPKFKYWQMLRLRSAWKRRRLEIADTQSRVLEHGKPASCFTLPASRFPPPQSCITN
jgi:hypothetical protein